MNKSEMTKMKKRLNSIEGKFAQAVTDFSGSMNFAYFHVIWFGLWIMANNGLFEPYITPFDEFPYGLLTMIVSLEAIFLSTFILVAQNRQALLDEYREIEEEKEEIEEEMEIQDIQKDLDDIKNAISQIEKKSLKSK